jgi:hypothetical protein
MAFMRLAVHPNTELLCSATSLSSFWGTDRRVPLGVCWTTYKRGGAADDGWKKGDGGTTALDGALAPPPLMIDRTSADGDVLLRREAVRQKKDRRDGRDERRAADDGRAERFS